MKNDIQRGRIPSVAPDSVVIFVVTLFTYSNKFNISIKEDFTQLMGFRKLLTSDEAALFLEEFVFYKTY